MKVTVHRWLTEPHFDIRRWRTQVTVRTDSVICAISLCGYMNRAEAIERAASQMQQSGQWGNAFIREVYTHARRKRTVA